MRQGTLSAYRPHPECMQAVRLVASVARYGTLEGREVIVEQGWCRTTAEWLPLRQGSEVQVKTLRRKRG